MNKIPLRQWYIEHGICVSCGQRDAFNGRQKCPECLEKARLSNAKYRSLERDRSYYPRRKEKRDARIAEGLCTECGKKATRGKVCTECYTRRRRKREKEKLEREMRGDPRRIRVANGKCWFCDNTALDGMKICARHYEEIMNRPGFAKRGDENHPWTKEETARMAELKSSRNGCAAKNAQKTQ